MAYPTLLMNGKQYVLVPKGEFDRMTAQDRAEAKKAKRTMAAFRAGKLRTTSHAALKRELGL